MKILLKIYRDCTRIPFNFLTVDTKNNKFIKNVNETL